MTALTLVVAPAQEPITLQEAKDHLRETNADQDDLIAGLIVAAREWAETFTRRALVTQTWDWTLDDFQTCLIVPKGSLQSVTRINYVDAAGVTQTLASTEYTVDAASDPGRIVEAYGKAWPSTLGHINDIAIRFVAGYGGAENVPQQFKQAILLLIGEFYERREIAIAGVTINEVPVGAKSLLLPFRLPAF